MHFIPTRAKLEAWLDSGGVASHDESNHVGFSQRSQILRLSLIDRLDAPISRRSAMKAAFRDFMEVTSVNVQRRLCLVFLKHHRKLKN